MSKELEAWKRVRESAENADGDAAVYEIGDCDIVEKSLKALKIIKNKKLDVCSFINYFVERNDSYETYVLYFEQPIEIDYCVISEELLTEEEFNLVKEVLSDEA